MARLNGKYFKYEFNINIINPFLFNRSMVYGDDFSSAVYYKVKIHKHVWSQEFDLISRFQLHLSAILDI